MDRRRRSYLAIYRVHEFHAVRYALFSKFLEIRQLKPFQEEVLFKFIQREDMLSVLPAGCSNKSLIFQVVPVVCSYLHDQGFNYPKNAVLVVICPLSSLIESHIQEFFFLGTLLTQRCLLLARFAHKKIYINKNNLWHPG